MQRGFHRRRLRQHRLRLHDRAQVQRERPRRLRGPYPDSLDDPKQETIAELLRRTTGKSIGVVSDAEIEDATPASVVGHTRRRADKARIVDMFYSVKPDVIIGGGSAYFLPQNVPGSKRKDDKNYVEMFQKEGYALATSNTELSKAVKGNPDKLLGLFHTGNMDGVLDRKFLKKGTVSKFPDQPDLTDSMRAALSVLSKNPEGFFLMLEAGLVDKYSHPLDWERAVYDTIMFDKVVAMAQEFCDKNPDTLLIVTGDHTHSISVIGTVDDNLPGELMRDKVGIYAEAGYPAYKDENGDGYPDDVNVSKRLAVFIGNYPDHYETYRPKMDGPFVPSVKDEKGPLHRPMPPTRMCPARSSASATCPAPNPPASTPSTTLWSARAALMPTPSGAS